MRAVGLDTPGPASADGVISSQGRDQLRASPDWCGFDFRGALEERLGLPVVYNNDGNAAALYAHHVHFGADAAEHSSVSAIVGTGLGGGVIESRPGRQGRGRAWRASSATCTSRCTACSTPASRCRSCNCGFAATPRASPR